MTSIHLEKLYIVTETELERVSALTTATEVLAVFHIPEDEFLPSTLHGIFSLALDHIADPGNLGTIIRIADWFGIDHIVCSEDSVECWNPKVVQATMGSLGRVSVHYTNLEILFETLKGFPIVGAVMNGTDFTKVNPPKEGILLMGNESHGISEELATFITDKITIPQIPHEDFSLGSAESLNVGVATGILCGYLRRS